MSKANGELFLKKGERGCYIGKSGSGKTSGAVWQLRNTTLAPIVVFNTKGEPEPFEVLPREYPTIEAGTEITAREELDTIKSLGEFKSLKHDELAEYTIVEPTADELYDPIGALDAYLITVYERLAPCLVYIDEAYAFHKGTSFGPGLNQLLTRGRSRGITTLLGVQRPAFVNRAVFTESNRFFIYRLMDERDRATVANFVPGFDELAPPDQHHFYFYSDKLQRAELYGPVPMYKPLPPRASDVPKTAWL